MIVHFRIYSSWIEISLINILIINSDYFSAKGRLSGEVTRFKIEVYFLFWLYEQYNKK
jgi:hypothetical protein